MLLPLALTFAWYSAQAAARGGSASDAPPGSSANRSRASSPSMAASAWPPPGTPISAWNRPSTVSPHESPGRPASPCSPPGRRCQPGHPARGMRRGALRARSPRPVAGRRRVVSTGRCPRWRAPQAATVAGALHGLETFAQLVGPGAEGFRVPAIHIEDRPRFPWRGLMLDVSRHWMPVEVVERNLDAMAAVKLNVFHWHLSDDQGFRVESRRFPRLQQLGSDGDFYTQAEIRHVVAYARDRGIRVVPEFDMPGHTNSWLVGYPELASAPGPYSIGRTWGVYDGAMDPTREETYEFLDAFLGEMTQLFPDPYFHIGGDEVNGRQWSQSSSIQAFAKPQARRRARPPGVLQPAHSKAAAEVREDHGGVGRGAAPRSPGGHRGAILARAGIAGRGGLQRLPRNSLGRLLPGPPESGQLPLRHRPAGGRRAEAHSRRGVPHSGRRGLHVGRIRQRGDRGLAHLAARRGDRRKAVVAQGSRRRCGVDVRAHGSRQPRAGVDRRAAPCQLRPHAGPPRRRPPRRTAADFGGRLRSPGTRPPRPRHEVHQPDPAEPFRGRRAPGKRKRARPGAGGRQA
jgi:hypothetical protein